MIRRAPLVFAALGVLALARAAHAQPIPEVGPYDPSSMNPPAPPAPAGPTIITIGPDGQPVAPPAQTPTGVYHYDDLLDRSGDQDDNVVLHAGPTPELHVVRRGDTLWDICWYYFNDPWQWPKVWSYNPQITNPHWIYPGDLVRLLPKGFLNPTPIPDSNNLEDETEPQTQPTDQTPSRNYGVSVRQVAFLDKKHYDSSMFIVGGTEEKELLSTDDQVYVSYKDGQVPRVGDRFSIYAEDTPATNPGTGKVIGSYVRVQGELRIESVKQDKRATARILSSNGEIERGMRVGPLVKQFHTVPPARNEVDLQGNIVAMLTRDELIGSGEVVFIDLGQKSGLKAGNTMFVVRRGDALEGRIKPDTMIGQDDRDFPARILGKVVIVEVGPTLSTGLVTLSAEEMGIGDLVMMRKQ